jgi:hypothetical protein
MKTHFYLLPLFAARLIAAEPPVPPAPFSNQAPANSSFTIRIKSKEGRDDKAATDAPGVQGGAMAAPKTKVLTQIQIDKSGTMRRILRKWSDGKSVETWWLGPLCLEEYLTKQGSREIHVIDTSPVQGAIIDTGRLSASLASGGDYLKGDFPELSWIEPDMRVGNATKNEVEFHVYRMTGSVAPTKTKVDMTMPESLKNAKSPAGDKAAPVPANATVSTVKEAWIKASTKLPSKLIDGEQTWTYSYSSEPPNLQLPPECSKALQAYKAALEDSKNRRLP